MPVSIIRDKKKIVSFDNGEEFIYEINIGQTKKR